MNTPDEINLELLRQLESQPHLNQRGLADRLGLSLGKANYCLRALVRKGLVKISNFRRSDNKLAYAYLLTPSGMQEKARLVAAPSPASSLRLATAIQMCQHPSIRLR